MKNIIESIKSACKDISYLLRNYISNRRSSNLYNSSGDNVNTIDLVANDIIKEYLRNCSNIKMIASEEEEELITIRFDGDYFVVFDPLDGSKNIDNNLVTGTIFGIFKLNGKKIDDLHGYDLVCSGYCLYSSATILVLCEEKVNMYLLKNDKFVLKKENIVMPNKGKVYSVNEGNKNKWDSSFKNLINTLVLEKRSNRWAGCMVADVHRVLMEGGIFMYPIDNENKHGKLRILYEAFPMAHITEKMGGKSAFFLNCKQSILNFKMPKYKHQKVPVFLGSEYEMKLLL